MPSIANGPGTGGAVYHAMGIIKGELAKYGGISKDRDAPAAAGGFRFRGIDDVYNVLCGLTADWGLSMWPRVVEVTHEQQTNDKGRTQTHVHLVMEVDFVAVEDGSSHTVRTIGEALDTSDKASNKAMSAAMKYACLMTFMVPTEGGDDIEHEHIEQAPKAPSKQEAKPVAKAKAPPPPPPEEEDDGVIEGICQAVDAANSFKLLFDLSAETESMAAIAQAVVLDRVSTRVAYLCKRAPDLATLKESEPLIKLLKKPKVLMQAYNERYAELRQPTVAEAT